MGRICKHCGYERNPTLMALQSGHVHNVNMPFTSNFQSIARVWPIFNLLALKRKAVYIISRLTFKVAKYYVLCAFFVSGPVAGQTVYKCTDDNGNHTYTADPCPLNDEQRKVDNIDASILTSNGSAIKSNPQQKSELTDRIYLPDSLEVVEGMMSNSESMLGDCQNYYNAYGHDKEGLALCVDAMRDGDRIMKIIYSTEYDIFLEKYDSRDYYLSPSDQVKMNAYLKSMKNWTYKMKVTRGTLQAYLDAYKK